MMRSILIAVLIAVGQYGTGAADEISDLQARMKAEYITGTSSSASSYLGSQRTDGSWSDINYGATDNGWAPINHLKRVRQMAISYCKSPNSSMLAGVSKGLTYWYTRKPSSTNWWWNEIGTQQQLGPILIMMEDYLAESVVTGGAAWLYDPDYTGQNLVWMATETLWRGCLLESRDDIMSGAVAIKNEVRITDGDGTQPDGSFYQHGKLIYNGGYGEGFVQDCSYWAYMMRGFSFGFEDAKLDILSELILDGTQWMIRRGYIDFSVNGREISRNGSLTSGGFKSPVSRMVSLNTGRKAEFSAMLNHLNNADDNALTGDKHFYRNDYHVHRQNGYMIGIRMFSNRTRGTESLNGENLKGYYLSCGATAIMPDGNEYHDLQPVWDWARIPGITMPHKTTLPAMPTSITGKSSFVGGASDGNCGATVMDLNWDGMTGKKAWFTFNGCMVALGAGLAYAAGSEPVYTNLNQCYSSGTVTVSYDGGSGSTVGTGQQVLSSPRWIYHDKVGYVFLKAGSVTLKNQSQSGTWRSIRTAGSSSTVTKTVFSLWIDHGTRPANADYRYIVIPGATAAATQGFFNANPITVLANIPTLQAVYHATFKQTGIVFHQAGQVTLGSGLTVKSDQSCVVLVDENLNTVTAANPLNQAMTVTITLTAGTVPEKPLVFNLPDGIYAGQSATMNIPGTSSDTEKPTVTRVYTGTAPDRVYVSFSEKLDPAPAATTTNYSIAGLTVSGATLGTDGKTVTLTVSSMTTGSSYTLAVSGIKDLALPANTVATVQKQYTFYRAYVDDFDTRRLTWSPLTASRWSVVTDGTDKSYYLNTSSYASGDQKPGEYSLLNGLSTARFDFYVSVKSNEAPNNSSPDYGVIFGYEDNDNFWYFLSNSIANANILYKVAGGIRYEMLNLFVPLITDDQYHDLQFAVDGTYITIRFDGQDMGRVKGTVASGQVGFCSYNDAAWFDDFAIIPTDGAVMGIADSRGGKQPGNLALHYPSPARGVVRFTAGNGSDGSRGLAVLDVAGQVVAEPAADSEGTWYWDSSGMAAGRYFIRIQDNGVSNFRQIVIIP